MKHFLVFLLLFGAFLSWFGCVAAAESELNVSIVVDVTPQTIIISESELDALSNDDILSSDQIALLKLNFSVASKYASLQLGQSALQSEKVSSDPITDGADSAKRRDASSTATEDFSASDVIFAFVSTANVLYSCGCLILTVSYVVLLYWFRRDPYYIRIGLTLGYHYIFHILAGSLAKTISSRILAAILYMCCCVFPSICVLIYRYTDIDSTLERIQAQKSTAQKEINVWKSASNLNDIETFIFTSVRNTRDLMSVWMVGLVVMYTSCLYFYISGFAGTLAPYFATLFVLMLLTAIQSRESALVNGFFSALFPNRIYDFRFLYAAVLYWLILFPLAYFAPWPAVRVAALISALNAFWWSFPLILLLDIIQPEFVHYLITMQPGENLPAASERINNWMRGAQLKGKDTNEDMTRALSLFQYDATRYRAFVLILIAVNTLMLHLSIVNESWIPVPYAVATLWCLSFALPATRIWSLTVHLPIAMLLFRACLAYIYIVDTATLEAIRWIGPQQIILWVILTGLRAFTAVVSCSQLLRALFCVLIDVDNKNETRYLRWLVHCCALALATVICLVMAHLDTNYWVSKLYLIASYVYFAILQASFMEITKNGLIPPIVGDVITSLLAVRYYVLSFEISFLFPLIAIAWSFKMFEKSFSVWWRAAVKSRAIGLSGHFTLRVLFICVLYTWSGLIYQSKLLVLMAVLLACVFVSDWVYRRTESKRAALIALTVLAVVIIQLGLGFESGGAGDVPFIFSAFGYTPKDMIVTAGDNGQSIAMQCFEFGTISYHFRHTILRL